MIRCKGSKMLLLGVWANRNWILGNWLKEVKLRAPYFFTIVWLPTIFAGKRWFEKYIPKVLPTHSSYFFSYLTIFESYLQKNNKIINRSIVLYPHNEPELGTLEHQANILNNSFAVYFFCSFDADTLVNSGLESKKVRIAHCAVDVDCVPNETIIRDPNTVVLASRYGPRKGLELLPDIVSMRPDMNFIALGRGWEEFIASTKINLLTNFSYYELTKASRNTFFAQAGIFLSLSNLEGGPVPLIEAMQMGAYPVVTKTGFAPDLIKSKQDGIIIPTNPTIEQVLSALDNVIVSSTNRKMSKLTWDRITSLMISDHLQIVSSPI